MNQSKDDISAAAANKLKNPLTTSLSACSSWRKHASSALMSEYKRPNYWRSLWCDYSGEPP